MLNFNKFKELQYKPFPIGAINPIFSDDTFDQLSSNYPSLDFFKDKSHELGNKFSLSIVNNRKNYFDFINNNKIWYEFYHYTQSDLFFRSVLSLLNSYNIKLFNSGESFKNKNRKSYELIDSFIKKISFNKLIYNKNLLSSKFEFSVMTGNGGCIKPHTDSPRKIITLVICMTPYGEWDKNWGGGTSVVEPKDDQKYFNKLNEQLEFEEVNTLKTYEFESNQCLLFVKTFNSLHCVHPINADKSILRKSLTINIFLG